MGADEPLCFPAFRPGNGSYRYITTMPYPISDCQQPYDFADVDSYFQILYEFSLLLITEMIAANSRN